MQARHTCNVGQEMKSFPAPISSDDLRATDIPLVFGSWSDIIEFAATFSPQAEFKEKMKPKGIAEIPVDSTVKEIRAALFHEYRRYNHYGFPPSEEVKQQCLQAIAVLRTKVK